MTVFVLFIFVLLDYLWLHFAVGLLPIQKGHFLSRQSSALTTPIWWASTLAWLIMPLGIIFFVFPRVSIRRPLLSALSWGFLYGVILFAIYDLARYSAGLEWPTQFIIVDIFWGGVLCGLVTCCVFLLDSWFG
jgi:uncharacterized membrane protein